MTTPDLFVALAPVLDVLRRLGVRHYVGGSIASSAHGVPRSSIDADVVAELGPAHAAPFAAALHQGYYVSEERVRDAIARRASFNVIHHDGQGGRVRGQGPAVRPPRARARPADRRGERR